jgi:hypothetical protein
MSPSSDPDGKLDDALASAAVYRTGLPARLITRAAADPDVAAILERISPRRNGRRPDQR